MPADILPGVTMALRGPEREARVGDFWQSVFGGFAAVLWIGVAVLVVIGYWKIFVKAGQPGWAAIIPFYNIYILLKIVGRPGWWLVLMIIPLVNIVVSIIVAIDLAKCFGQGGGFAVGLILLSVIFYAILAFGDFRYEPMPA